MSQQAGARTTEAERVPLSRSKTRLPESFGICVPPHPTQFKRGAGRGGVGPGRAKSGEAGQ